MPRFCFTNSHRFYIGTASSQSKAMVGFVVHFRLRAVAQVHGIATAAAGQAYHCYQQQLLHHTGQAAFFLGQLNTQQVSMGMKKIATVSTDMPISAVWLPRNLLACPSGKKCSYSDSSSLMPNMPITIKALVSRKAYFSISCTNHWAIKRMAKMPMKTPVHTSMMLGVKATAANTLSIEKAISISSTRHTVAQKLPSDPTVILYSQLPFLSTKSSSLVSVCLPLYQSYTRYNRYSPPTGFSHHIFISTAANSMANPRKI